jgi:hypothetical protein
MRCFSELQWSANLRSTDHRSANPRSSHSSAARALVLLLALRCVAFAAPAPPNAPHGTDLDGHPVLLAQSAAPAIVLFFTASDCPISNRYEPEMLRLQQKFAAAGVEFWWVYPNPGDTAEVIRRHQAQFPGSARVLRDTQQLLIHLSRATVTPEAAVLIPGNGTLREVYHGRIDDRYIALGQERPRAMHHELEDAIAALLAKRAIPPPNGPPVGCSIVPLKDVSQ